MPNAHFEVHGNSLDSSSEGFFFRVSGNMDAAEVGTEAVELIVVIGYNTGPHSGDDLKGIHFGCHLDLPAMIWS